MPISPLAKNKGPLLTTKIRGTVDNFPPEFLANVGLDILVQEVPLDIGPDEVTALLIESKTVQERTNERKKTNTYLTQFPDDDLPSETFIDESGMTGERHRSLVPEGTPLPVDNRTESGDQRNLGNGWLDQIVVEAPDLYEHNIFERERRILTPDDFLGLLPIRTHAHTEDGQASDPVMAPGDISTTDEDQTIWHHRVTEKDNDVLALPMENVNKRTTSVKQFETVTRILELDTTVPSDPTATRNVTFTKLGDGTAVEVHEDVDSVFGHGLFTKTRPVVTPEDFRALIQETGHAETDEGLAAAPVLSPGEISAEDEQVDVFDHRLTTREIPIISLPQTIQNERTNSVKQTETVFRTLELETEVPADPSSVQNVTFTKLGDGTALQERFVVDEIFPQDVFGRERSVVTPQDFRALIQESSHAQTEEGLASDPILAVGELSRTDEQVDVFDHRTTSRFLPLASIPQTIQNERTNEFKQVETIFRTLELDTTPPADPSSVQNVTFTKLGDGTALEERAVVDEIFPKETFTRERPTVTPQDFRALLQESSHGLTEEGVAVDPVLTPGEVSVSDEQVDVFDHRITTRFLPLVDIPQTLVNERTNEVKQKETVYRTLELDTAIPADPSSVQNVVFTRLGDGTAVEERSVVDEIFPRETFARERSIVTPQDFRALLQEATHALTEEGVASDPTLTPGQVSVTDEQVDVFDHRTTTHELPLVSIPQTIQNERTNEFKQVETVMRILELDTTIPAAPTSTQNVTFTKLGDGTAVEERFIVPEVFDHATFSEERPVVTPTDFRATLHERATSIVEPGLAAPPTLSPGDISRSEEQVDVFDIRSQTRDIDVLLLPQTILNERTNEFKQTEQIFRTLELDTVAPADPTGLQNVSFTKLGDGTALQERFVIDEVFDRATFTEERPVVTPQDFRATLHERATSSVGLGLAAPPTLSPGDISRSAEQLDVFTMRDQLREIDILTLPQTLINERTNEFKQLETVFRTLELDTATPADPTGTQNVAFTKLGDGTALQERFVVDEIFGHETFAEERPVVTPQDFRATLHERSTSVVEPGIAAPPTLAAGDISKTVEQVDVFDIRSQTRDIDTLLLPQTILNERTNEFKQTEQIFRTLELDTVAPADPTGLQNVSFTKLGDGTALQERFVIDSVFGRASFSEERPVVTPQDFRATLHERTTSLVELGLAAAPTLTAGDISRSQEQLDVFTMRDQLREIDSSLLPETIINERTNEFKQVETIYRTLELDTVAPAAPSAVQSVVFTKLGDGTALQERTVVPEVFDRERFTRERGVVTPPDFRALLQEQEHSIVEPGIAADPTLVAGEISHTEQQVDVFDFLETIRTIDTLSLPAQIVNKKTNEFKQVETVTRILELDTATPATPTGLLDVSFTKLGDGTAIEERIAVPSLFDHHAASTELADVLPEIFKATLASHLHETVVDGNVVDPPVLAPGDLEKVEQQVDLFHKRVRTRGRAGVTLPQTVIAQRKFGGEPYGGEVTRNTLFLDDSEPLVEVDYEIAGSEVTNLGNGQWVRSTEHLDSAVVWPLLHGQEYDEGLDVLIPFVEQVIEQNTEIGVPKTDIKPLNKTKARKRTIDSTAAEAVLGTYLMEYPSKIAVNMPDKLVSLTSQMTNQTGDAADSETGSSSGFGSFSMNLDLRADATASATVIPEVFAEIKQFYAPNVDCTHYVFFLPNPVTRVEVIAKINSLISPATVQDWPKFNPQTLTLLIVGGNAALKVNAVSKGSYSQSADLTSQSNTTGGGTGYSRAKGLTIRRMQISPTIHGALTMSGTTSSTVDLEAACSSDAAGLGPAETIDVVDSIGANVSPTTFLATDGATTWPTTGKFLYRVDARPYKYGFVMFHAIVVDAADFPTNP